VEINRECATEQTFRRGQASYARGGQLMGKVLTSYVDSALEGGGAGERMKGEGAKIHKNLLMKGRQGKRDQRRRGCEITRKKHFVIQAQEQFIHHTSSRFLGGKKGIAREGGKSTHPRTEGDQMVRTKIAGEFIVVKKWYRIELRDLGQTAVRGRIMLIRHLGSSFTRQG